MNKVHLNLKWFFIITSFYFCLTVFTQHLKWKNIIVPYHIEDFSENAEAYWLSSYGGLLRIN